MPSLPRAHCSRRTLNSQFRSKHLYMGGNDIPGTVLPIEDRSEILFTPLLCPAVHYLGTHDHKYLAILKSLGKEEADQESGVKFIACELCIYQ